MLPLTDDGRIYCGTCHFFHDAALEEDAQRPAAWVPPTTGLPGAVQRSVAAHWKTIERQYDLTPPVAEFETKGTTALRLPVENGSLCHTCHESLAR